MVAETATRKREVEARRAEPTRVRRTYVPPVDIIEQKDGLLMLLDMPGVEPGNVEIEYENGLLTVHGKVEPRDRQDATYLLHEYGTGDYYRTFTVGEGIDANKIEASYRYGVLELRLPKAETLKPRKIEVKG